MNETATYKTELDALIGLEDRTYKESLDALGDTIDLVHSMATCYSAFIDLIGKIGALEPSENQLVLLELLIGSKMQLATGAAALLRGHSSDCRGYLRKAIEFVLFAINIFERPGAAEKWLKAAESKTAWDEYRQHFHIMEMLSLTTYDTLGDTEKLIVGGLIDKYEGCCVQVHATHLAIGGQMHIEQTETGHQVQVGFIDSVRGSETTRLFLHVIDSHIQIVMMYAHLATRLGSGFDVQITYPLTGIMRLKWQEKMDQWQPILWPEGDDKVYEKFWDLPKKDRKRTKIKPSKPNDNAAT